MKLCDEKKLTREKFVDYLKEFELLNRRLVFMLFLKKAIKTFRFVIEHGASIICL